MSEPSRSASRADLPGRDAVSRLPWVGVAGALAILLVTAVLLVSGFDDGPRPPFLEPGAAGVAPVQRDDEALHLAGSGSNLPLTRALVAAQGAEPKPIVHASIGSGGGIRALLDGAIDVALVSRPLKPSEREQGLVSTPYARVPVIVAVNTSVPDTGIDGNTLLEIYRGDKRAWRDGSPIVVLQREQGDSSHRAVASRVPEFEPVNEQAYREGRWRVLYHEAEMREALISTPGAIGIYAGAEPAGESEYRALSFAGVEPSAREIASGVYPFSKALAFVTRGRPEGEARMLIEFALLPEARALIRQRGGVPLPEEE